MNRLCLLVGTWELPDGSSVQTTGLYPDIHIDYNEWVYTRLAIPRLKDLSGDEDLMKAITYAYELTRKGK